MQVIADFHLHSKYSRATSKNLDLAGLAQGANIKGLNLLGTGDFLHPVWVKELKTKLSGEDGIYNYSGMKFVLSGEVSLIYSQGGRGRRVHHVMLAPDFEVLDQIIEYFKSKGRVDYDGRPIFGMNSIEVTDSLMSISKNIEIIPAHAWTPWFGLLGSMSGFDSLSECFGDQTKHIHAIETGLSSDPPMNWRLSSLDEVTLLSNSDSHSAHPHRLGREANVFDLKDVTYKSIIDAIRTRNNFSFTIEVDPSYGKYHYDGHRNCNFSCGPKESAKLNNICPKCNRKLTIGVLNRVESLADRPDSYRPKDAVDYKSLVPLTEVISNVLGVGVFTKKVFEVFNLLIDRFKNEYNILLNVPREELEKVTKEKIVNAILLNREGKVRVIPGYDGEYGKPIFEEEVKGQKKLEEFFK